MSPGFTGRTPTRPRLRWSERRSGSLTAPQRDTSDWRAIAASSPRHRPERLRPMANIAKGPDGRWRARYRDPSGKEHAGHFPRKVDAQKWLDRETAKLQTGIWVEPKSSKITVAEWCQTWLAGYGTRKHSTVRGSPRQDHGSVRVASARLPATLGHQVMTVQLQVEHTHTSTPCMLGSRRSSPMPSMTVFLLARRHPDAPLPVPAHSDPTWPQRNRSGDYMTRWGSGTGRGFCWPLSPVCGSPRSAG